MKSFSFCHDFSKGKYPTHLYILKRNAVFVFLVVSPVKLILRVNCMK